MQIFEINSSQFPLFTVQNKVNDHWYNFIDLPFRTEVEAKEHLEKILKYFQDCSLSDPSEQLRVVEYTREMWHVDLVKEALEYKEISEFVIQKLHSDFIAKTIQDYYELGMLRTNTFGMKK